MKVVVFWTLAVYFLVQMVFIVFCGFFHDWSVNTTDLWGTVEFLAITLTWYLVWKRVLK